MTEKRSDPRINWLIEADVYVPDNDVNWKMRLTDISESGCFLDSLVPLQPASKVLLKINQGDIHLELPGKIQYGIPGIGSAIKFEPLNPKLRASLSTIIESRRPKT